MRNRLTSIIVCSLALLGCATQAPPTVLPDPAEIKLAEAAASVSHSLNTLAEVEQAANPRAKVKAPPNPASYGMGHLVSIDWSGPIEPLIGRIAHSAGYRLSVLGQRPTVPVIVTLFEKNVPMGDILRDAGFQANNRADVIVFPGRRLVEIRYPNG